MVSHQRLQHYRANYCLLCMTGLLGCRWHRYKQSTRDSRKRDLLSFTVLLVTFLYVLFYFYFWLVAANDLDDFNWYIYTKLSQWFAWYTLFLALISSVFVYYVILMCLVLLHIAHGHQLYVYPLHLVVSVVTLAACISTTIIVDNIWHTEWIVLQLSLQMTGPFLHVGVVFFMTCLTWIIAGQWLQLSHKAPVFVWTTLKFLWLGIYVCVMLFLYLVPLLFTSPCVVTLSELPAKPGILGHRGAPALAPENTMLSFESAVQNGVAGFETDVRISYDGVPFLIHDGSLRRTTNISQDGDDIDASFYNMSQLKSLDAGSWFLKVDPFNSASSLSEKQRDAVKKQTIPTFAEFLQLAAAKDKRVIFDRFSPPSNHPYYNDTERLIVQAILESGIAQQKVFWLNDRKPLGGENFTLTSSRYMAPELLREHNFSAVNLMYGSASEQAIREVVGENVTVVVYTVNSVWMLSVYWCVGVDYVTSDRCDLLSQLEEPVWRLNPQSYLIMWITTDVVSVILVVTFFILQRVRLYGTKFNPETLSLQSGRTNSSYEQVYKSKNMKQKLLRNGDHFDSGLDQMNGSLNSSNLAVGSYCLHTINGSNQRHPSEDSVPGTADSADTSHTEIMAELR